MTESQSDELIDFITASQIDIITTKSHLSSETGEYMFEQEKEHENKVEFQKTVPKYLARTLECQHILTALRSYFG